MSNRRRAIGAGLLVGLPLVVGLCQLLPAQQPERTPVTTVVNERLVCPLAPVAGEVRTDPATATVSTLGAEPPSVLSGISGHLAGWYQAGHQWAAPCLAPRATAWLISPNAAVSEIYLVNPEGVAASVNLAFQGPDGRVQVQGSTGIVVAPRSARVVPLSVMVGTPGPIAVRLSTDHGRVAAYVRTTLDAKGDFVSPAAPDVSTILPGVPAKASKVTAFVANPGEDRASVSVEAMGASGAVALTGGQFDVTGGGVTAVDLTAAVAGEAVSLRVNSNAPVVAVVEVVAHGDVAYLSGALPDGGAQWAPAGSVLQVANPDDADATVTVHLGSAASDVTVAAGGSAEIPVEKDAWLQVSGGAGAIRAPGQGLGVVPLKAVAPNAGDIDLAPDPRVGR